uniref:D-alanyl-D-alanine carboxypeptidase n=1 Tax=Actinacidiphila rubida TaxID=310780 RepID=UPI000AEE973A
AYWLYGGDPRVAAYVSPPYSQYAKLILKVSHNLGANLALCNMAVEIGSRNCFDAFPVERDFLARVADIDPGQFQLSDGRGGTAADRITPRALVEILDYWLRTPRATDFRLLLPILGVNGSNAISCTTDCPAKGKVFAKPGTIIGDDLLNQQLEVAAQNEAGYLKTDDGRLLTFFVGVNGASSPSLDAFLSIFNDVNQITALLQEQASAPWRR